MSTSPNARVGGGSLTEKVDRLITEQIVDGTFVSGEKLPSESELMVRFSVSRTVIREAISRLQAAGLVEGNVFGPASGHPFATDPEEGSKVHRGSTVDIYLKK